MFFLKRLSANPILKPLPEHPFEDYATFNGNPIQVGSSIHMVYRAQNTPEKSLEGDFSMSTVGIAESRDGITFKNRQQLVVPTESWDRFGCEDPRVTKVGDKYFIFYTALSAYPFNIAGGIKIGLAISKDMKKVDEKHLITPFNSKAMTIFPEKIGGNYVAMLTVNSDNPPSHIALAEFQKLEDMWDEKYWKKWHSDVDKHIIMRGQNDERIEIGSCPIKTHAGWLVVYCKIQKHNAPDRVFAVEAFLLDLKDPRKIVGKTRGALMVPEEDYELRGLIGNIIFPSGAIVVKDRLRIYYGATDTVVAAAEVNLDDLLDAMKLPHMDTGFKRLIEGALLVPKGDSWESKAVFNPAAIDIDGTVHILFRAMSQDNTSVIGHAESENGIDITKVYPDPVYKPREGFEKKRIPGGNSGCEDPRITRIGNTIYMYYTAYNGVEPPAVAQTHISVESFKKGLWNWSKPVLVTKSGVDDKDGCLHPEKVKGKYFLFHRVNNIICGDYGSTPAFTERNEFKNIPVLFPRHGMWDSVKVGISVPPIYTKKGWLLLYHGVSQSSRYRIGAALLDLKDPTKVIARTSDPIFEPRKSYETHGQVNNVVFPCGAVVRDDTIFMYYGGADSVVDVASISLKKLIDVLTK